MVATIAGCRPLLQRPERARRAPGPLDGVDTAGNLPPVGRLDQIEGVNPAVAELAVHPEVIWRPERGNRPVDADLRAPHALAMLLLPLAKAIEIILDGGPARGRLTVL